MLSEPIERLGKINQSRSRKHAAPCAFLALINAVVGDETRFGWIVVVVGLIVVDGAVRWQRFPHGFGFRFAEQPESKPAHQIIVLSSRWSKLTLSKSVAAINIAFAWMGECSTWSASGVGCFFVEVVASVASANSAAHSQEGKKKV